MRLFPATRIKEFSACEHGEFINVRTGVNLDLGLCIHNEDAKPHFLVLDSLDKDLVYNLIEPKGDKEALAFGTNWTLSRFGELLKQHEAAGKFGAFIQTREGLFIVGREYGVSGDPLLCRLDKPGISKTLAPSTTGFAFLYWQIDYFDEMLSKCKHLADNKTISGGKK